MKDINLCQNSKAAKICIVIVGTPRVGKTVRYLTKRFIGDYISGVDLTYQHTMPHFTAWGSGLEILDTSGTKEILSGRISELNQRYKALAFVVVYSLTDSDSFTAAQDLLLAVPERCSRILVANKSDLHHRRQVSLEDGRLLAARYNTDFFEVSAADNQTSVVNVFQTIIHKCVSHVPISCPKICISAFSKLLGSLVSIKSSNSRSKKLSTSSSSSSGSTPYSTSPSVSTYSEKSKAIPINRKSFFRPKSQIVSI